MSSLIDSQILLLDTLIYCFDREASVRSGMTVDQLTQEVDSGLKRFMAKERACMHDLGSEMMTYEEWFAIIDAIRRDTRLNTLVMDLYHHDAHDGKMACFSDSLSNAYVIFSGTGDGEWRDDCYAAFLADSDQQLSALSWFKNQVLPKKYRSITVSGHSKGGNKAQYLGIRAGEDIQSVVSFDGQGFSREFLSTYQEEIDKYAHKITAYALDNDYVNGLLNPVAPQPQRLFILGPNLREPLAYHAPFSLFGPRKNDSYALRINRTSTQGAIGRLSVRLTDYLQSEAPYDDFVKVCSCLADIADLVMNPGSRNEIAIRLSLAKINETDSFAMTMKYFSAFFHSVAQSEDPENISVFREITGFKEFTMPVADSLKSELAHLSEEVNKGQGKIIPIESLRRKN
ncbi:MAG: Mbeg1-like protein [Eggerthellaceae bacterium]|jgi:hypothetical protein